MLLRQARVRCRMSFACAVSRSAVSPVGIPFSSTISKYYASALICLYFQYSTLHGFFSLVYKRNCKTNSVPYAIIRHTKNSQRRKHGCAIFFRRQPCRKDMNNIEWFREAKYGMMVHFGLYSMLAGEYRGRRTPYDYGEWIQSAFAIPNREMEQLAGAFNPVYFNAEEWVKLAKECGMTYFVVTSKHHEGFALFDSDCDAYNIKKATPFGRDLIAELAEACYKHGLKLGLYYSQELDWHHPHGGGYDKTTGCAGTAWYNNWDFPGADNKDYSICFNEKIKPQVKEIMTKYGDICLIWFDTPGVMTKAQSQELYDLVKQYQPDCLVNSRLGNGVYDYVSLGDNEIPAERPAEISKERAGDMQSMNDLFGFKYSPYNLYETAATLNDTWGFKYYDHNWKTPEQILANKQKLNGMGVNYLLNVGPDALGRIPSYSVDILRRVRELETQLSR